MFFPVEALLSLLGRFSFLVSYVFRGSSFPQPLDSTEEAEAIARWLEGDQEARDVLIERNLRLVAHVAKKYVGNGRDSEDLISIGTIGLIKAINTYDNTKGTLLGTYAARCIENEILMSIRTAKKLKNETSLHDPIGVDKEGNEISLLDILGSSPDNVVDQVDMTLRLEELQRLLERCLDSREKMVIQLRYGLGNSRCMTQREIAKLLCISRSYVSRIEKKALSRLCAEFGEGQA